MVFPRDREQERKGKIAAPRLKLSRFGIWIHVSAIFLFLSRVAYFD
jgi:hypothetical protein